MSFFEPESILTGLEWRRFALSECFLFKSRFTIARYGQLLINGDDDDDDGHFNELC